MQSHESKAQSADSSKPWSKSRDFICIYNMQLLTLRKCLKMTNALFVWAVMAVSSFWPRYDETVAVEIFSRGFL